MCSYLIGWQSWQGVGGRSSLHRGGVSLPLPLHPFTSFVLLPHRLAVVAGCRRVVPHFIGAGCRSLSPCTPSPPLCSYLIGWQSWQGVGGSFLTSSGRGVVPEASQAQEDPKGFS
ncbi:MAG: hypothetical protein IJ767_03935 [Bacteroidaceae bacterium]|nr:hypothetical protein [Bacteroidaceae bacterium]